MYIATFFNILWVFNVVAIIVNKYCHHISYLSYDWLTSSTVDQSYDCFLYDRFVVNNTFKMKTTSIFPVSGPASLMLMSKYDVTEFL